MAKRKKRHIQPEQSTAEMMTAQLAAFKPLLSADEFALLQQEVDKSLPPAIRINPLKTDEGFTQALSERYGWTLTPIPFCQEGFRVEVNAGIPVSAALEHKTGQYYIQEAASMLPVSLFNMNDAKEDGLTLDLAASPGGKTTHLVSRQNDRGLILANDSSQGRIQALKVVLQHWGATNTAVTRFPGEKFGCWFSNVFDRVLIDAPCSMQGLRTADTHESRPVTEKESRLLSQRQIGLLTSALQAVHIGGEVVYSTCTLLPLEDEGVVETVLSKFGDAVKLLDTQKVLPKPAPGVQGDGETVYLHDMSGTVRLWPHRYQTAGFFACLFQKAAELSLKQADPPRHSMEAAGFTELTTGETTKFTSEFRQWSGYDLHKYLEENQRVLVRRDQSIFLFPRLLLERFRSLPVQSAGILLGEMEYDGFVPSHEWTLRFGAQCTDIVARLDDEQFELFSRGEDLAGYSDRLTSTSAIRVITDQNGRIAGRGKTLSDGLKNLSSRQLTSS